MARRGSSSNLDLRALWAEYKEACGRPLPERAGRFVQGRHFDRLLVGYAIYGVAAVAALALAQTLWPELLR
jgi:hypothetical protein